MWRNTLQRREAFIDMNGPTLPRADSLIFDALNHHFKGKTWHFSQTTARHKLGAFGATSKVLQRKLEEPSRLSFLELSDTST
jgi:hypothetical protein